MKIVRRLWKSTSIVKKLYALFGLMAFLILGELLVLGLVLDTLSAVRAFVAGEGSWSKAQKNAALSFQRFVRTRDSQDYASFLEFLRIPDGDHLARTELEKKDPDMRVVREGFLAGQIHPDDIDGMVRLLRRFYWLSYLQRSMAAWSSADEAIVRYKERAEGYRRELNSPAPDLAKLTELADEIKEINRELTELEDEFSQALGEGSRWLEGLVVMILFLVVLTVEGVGLTLIFLTSRSIKFGLGGIADTADEIGRGNLGRRVSVEGKDEIAHLGHAVNRMGEMLQNSYRELEDRVEARTQELTSAVRTRDDFLSVASHELKTPLTSLKLHIQMRRKAIDQGKNFDLAHLRKMVDTDEKQVNRITRLIDDMLDITRLSKGKFFLNKEMFDLSVMVRDVIDRFSSHFVESGNALDIQIEPGVIGNWDHFRAEQAFTNLLTNAMKYGDGKPIEISLMRLGGFARLTVRDQGAGIDGADKERIFRQFERAVPRTHIAGLGLGLFIVKEIMRAHGGDVELTSEPGKGSAFTLLFPL